MHLGTACVLRLNNYRNIQYEYYSGKAWRYLNYHDSIIDKQWFSLNIVFIVHSGSNSNAFYFCRVTHACLGYTPSNDTRVSMIVGAYFRSICTLQYYFVSKIVQIYVLLKKIEEEEKTSAIRLCFTKHISNLNFVRGESINYKVLIKYSSYQSLSVVSIVLFFCSSCGNAQN